MGIIIKLEKSDGSNKRKLAQAVMKISCRGSEIFFLEKVSFLGNSTGGTETVEIYANSKGDDGKYKLLGKI